MSRYGKGPPNFVWIPHWEYISGQAIVCDGTVQAATIPNGAQAFQIEAQGGDIQYQINSDFVVTGAGFVPENGARTIGPLTNLNALWVSGAAATIAHIQYWREYVT